MSMTFEQLVEENDSFDCNPFTKGEVHQLMDLLKDQHPQFDGHSQISLDDGFEIVKEFRTKDHDEVYVVGNKVFCGHEDGLIYEDQGSPLLDGYNVISPDLPRVWDGAVHTISYDIGLRLKTIESAFEVYKAIKEYRQMILSE